MGKKTFHKNSKKPTYKTPKPVIKKGIKKERVLLLDKVLLICYLAVGFLPHMNAFDVAITQWYYISILNVVTLGYIFYYKNFLKVDFHNKIVKYVFLGAITFVILSCLSIIKSISVSESIVFLSILLNTLIAFFNLYIIVKDKLLELFPFIAYTLMFFLSIESLQVIYHFAIKNASQPRSDEIFFGLNPTYGNRNILAASLIIKTAFTFYIFFRTRKRHEFWLSLIVVFFSIFSILLIGARTAIYSLPIVILILIIGSFYLKKEEGILALSKKYIIPLLVIFGLAIFSSLSINKIHKGKLNTFNNLVFTKKKDDLYKTSVKIVSLASDSGRKEFWNAAIDGFESSPIVGVGIGNWKMIQKENLVKKAKNSNHFYPRRAHNDFLQVLSEIGIFGFLLFIGLFGVVYYILITTFFKYEDKERRLIALISLAGFVIYSLDSLINFPSERTPIQLLGFLTIVIALSLLKKDRSLKFSKYFKFVLLGVGVVLIYLNYQMFTSAKYQLIVRNNIRGKNILKDKYKVSYDQMNQLYPSFPKLNFMGQPIDYAKAVLAYSEGKYIESMDHLNLAIEESPYTLEHYAFKSLIFRSNKLFKNQDSSIYYAKKAFYQRPGLINQYRILKKHYTIQKDTASLLDLINKHQDFLPGDENVWIDKINFYLKYPKDLKKASELIDSAKLVLPESKRIQDLKIINNNSGKEAVTNSDSLKLKRIELQNILNKASNLFNQKKYVDAYTFFNKGLELDTDNEEIRLSLALTDIKLKRYKEAIEKLNKIIGSGKITNGKPEYNRGLCYLRLNNKKAAGVDFRDSYDKGFYMAKELNPKILKY